MLGNFSNGLLTRNQLHAYYAQRQFRCLGVHPISVNQMNEKINKKITRTFCFVCLFVVVVVWCRFFALTHDMSQFTRPLKYAIALTTIA